MEWTYGENKYQRFYELNNEHGHACVFANKFAQNPDNYMCIIEWIGSGSICVGDKTYNDRQRKICKCNIGEIPRSTRPLQSEDIDYLKKKALHCLKYKKNEISQ